MPRLRGWPGEEARAVRRVHRLLRVSEVQVHAADHAGDQVPEVQGRRICEAREHGASGGRGRMRLFYGCSRYPDCDYTTPNMPIAEPCPKCGAPFIVEKKSKIGLVRACVKEGCDWEKLAPEERTGGRGGRSACRRESIAAAEFASCGVQRKATAERAAQQLAEPPFECDNSERPCGRVYLERKLGGMKKTVEKYLEYLRSVRNASPHTIAQLRQRPGAVRDFLTPPGDGHTRHNEDRPPDDP